MYVRIYGPQQRLGVRACVGEGRCVDKVPEIIMWSLRYTTLGRPLSHLVLTMMQARASGRAESTCLRVEAYLLSAC